MDIQLDGETRGPLAGIRVLDFSTVVSGPMCTQILGDLGADVVKVETPRGDSARVMGAVREGLGALFVQFNRNKRSVALDLKQSEGVEAARLLARDADVVVENFRPGVAERLGIGYEALSGGNPELIYVAISGFGSDGPYAKHPAYDSVIQGLAGFMRVQGDDDAPALIRCIAADKSSGITAAYATLAALLGRERGASGGQRIEVPMLDSFAAFALPDVFIDHTFDPPTPGGVKPGDVHRTWETADGHVVMMIVEDHHFTGLCSALDRDDVGRNPRYAGFLGRVQHAAELFEMVEAELRKRTTAEVVERGRRHGVPISPANGIAEFMADPQVASSRIVVEVDDPTAGPLRVLRNPARLPASPASLRRRPPRHGEHTEEVLRAAGYDEAGLARLREAGAIAG